MYVYNIYTYIYIYMCVYACLYVCMYVCLYVCIYVCIYVCMYVCMYVCINTCIHNVHVLVYLMYSAYTCVTVWDITTCHAKLRNKVKLTRPSLNLKKKIGVLF